MELQPQPLPNDGHLRIQFPAEGMLTIKEFAYYLGGPKPDGLKPQVSYHSARRIVRSYGGYVVVGNSKAGYEKVLVPIPLAREIKQARTMPRRHQKYGGR
jgi:hypothetical protein